VYRAQSAVLLEGEINVEALKAAITDVVSRHEILRTAFHLLPGLAVPLQVIESDQVVTIREAGLSENCSDDRRGRLEDLFQNETLHCSALNPEPAVKFSLLSLSASERILVTSLPSAQADGRSLKNLFREIARAYAARVRGAELPGEPVQYVDFAEWQKELLEQNVDDNEWIYGRNTQLSSPSQLTLGLEREVGAPFGRSPDCVSSALDSGATAKLERLSSIQRVSPEVFLLACWQILMWRLTGCKDLTIGYLCEGRELEELREVVGVFARFCPAHVHLEPDYQFTEMSEVANGSIRSARQRLGHFLRQDSEATDGRRLSEFMNAVGFEYEEWPNSESAGSVKFTYCKQSVRLDRFKLKLGCYRQAEGMTIQIEYDRSIFPRESVELIQERYLRLIEGVVENEHALIVDLEVVGRRERERLLVNWNATERRIPDRRCLHELIGEQARARPESIAGVYRQAHLSYGELDDRANRLAGYLKSLGVGPERVVGLYLERSTEMMIGLLGILKAGGAYLPLEMGQPIERQVVMLEDAGARVIVTTQGASAGLPVGVCELVMLDKDWERIAEYSPEAPEPEVSEENLAYVIYTSGSTGKPKGVMVNHGSLINLMEGLKAAIYEGNGEELSVSLNAPLAFDSSVKQVMQLSGGRRICVVPEEVRMDAESMLEYVRSQQVEALDCTPSQLRVLMEAGLGKGGKEPKIVLVGGEAIDERSWEEMSSSRRMRYYNLYGPTECTVDTTVSEVSEGGGPSIGRPLNNVRIYLLDENGRVAPVGMKGEICIGGAGLARGYLGEAGLTAERFVPDAYGGLEGERLYRSGDFGRYVEEGKIIYEGRRDGQVKVRGNRIELGEVSSVLKSHPGVREAVALMREDEPLQKRLVCYVVGTRKGAVNGLARHDRYAERGAGGREITNLDGAGVSVDAPWDEITEKELMKYVREKLPDYMTPAAVVVLEEMPLTRNGKVDREALPRPEEAKRQTSVEEGRRHNVYEEIISAIWKEVLKVEQVRVGDNFFEIGGHSLLATQVISRVRDTFKVEIGVRSVFEDATVEGFARRIADSITAGGEDEAPPLVRVSRDRTLPLSFAQQRLWFLDQLAPNNPFYNCPGAIRLEGRLNLGALESSINEIIRRHEVLRTRFEVVGGAPAQVIDEWEPRKLQVEDLKGLGRKERDEEAGRIVREDAMKGFDLNRGPLIRVKALELGEEDHVLLFTMHHIVSDAWSMEVLAREVGALYQAMIEGKESPLPELEIQYADYAVWQREYLAGEVLKREVGYWKEKLNGAAILELPTDRVRPAAPSYRGSIERVEISKESSEGMRRLSQREGATLFMALMAAFKVVLMRYSGKEDVSVGTPIANRTRREIEGLIGFFINTQVMRTDLGGNPSFRELIKREREVALGAYGHQIVPFEKLVEEINPERDLSRSPLFQVMMTMQNAGREGVGFSGLEVRSIGEEKTEEEVGEEEIGIAKFDLTMVLTEGIEGIEGVLEYSHDLYDRETVRRMARHYEQVVNEVVSDAERRLREIELLSGAERRQIIEEWNQTGMPYPQDRCIHQLFEHRAGTTPEAVALICDDRQLTYAELNSRANRLAHYLRRLAGGPETLVGICMERGLEMVIGLLGILKAGGAYVPIDPAYPTERIALMLEDAEVKALLTERRRLDILPGTSAQLVNMDADWRLIETESDENLPASAAAENLAYVIYTSGSTGRPKGVSVPHQQMVNFFTAMDAELDPDPASVWLAVTSISFDISVLELLWTLTRGFQVVIRRERGSAGPSGESDGASAERETALRPEESPANDEDFSIAAQIIKHRASHLQCTPSMAKILGMEMGPVNSLSSLCKIMIGGEAFPIGLAEALKPLATARIHNMYGPTETTVWSATYVLRGEERSIPIGRPIANTQLYILDREMQVVPVGVPGELYIGGKGVVRGYLSRSELTAERFMPDQFGAEVGARLYRTGDSARYLPDGNIEFLGRVDHQVKIRGFRIELGEIEAALLRHQAISEAVVIARGDEEKRLIAYLVGRDGLRVDLSELREYVKQILPEYMAPGLYVWLEKMPLTSNGKIDRMALPDPKEAGIARKGEYVAPRGPVEEVLAGMWSELLGVEKVGVHDNFFELGGHSLLLTQVVSRVRLAFSFDMPLRALFDAPTIRQLSFAIAAEQLSESDSIEAAELLQELQGLSPEEIQSMLESEMGEDSVKGEP